MKLNVKTVLTIAAIAAATNMALAHLAASRAGQ